MGIRHPRLRWTSGVVAGEVPWRCCVSELRARELALLHTVWVELKEELGPVKIEQGDILHFALEGLHMKLAGADREDVLLRVLFKLRDTYDVSPLGCLEVDPD